jgi:hypothetical protein
MKDKTPLQKILEYEKELTYMFDSDVRVGLALLEYIRENSVKYSEEERQSIQKNDEKTKQ